MKKLLSLTLALVMVLTLFVSCSPGEKKEKGPEKQRLENVYLTKEYKLPKDVYGVDIEFCGDVVYVLARREIIEKDEFDNDVYSTDTAVFTTDKNFSSFEEILTFRNENEWNDEDSTSTGKSVQTIFSAGDNELLLLYNKWYENWSDPEEYIYENSWSVEKISSDGSILSSFDLDFSSVESEYFYVSDIKALPDGKFLVIADVSAYILSADGKVEQECDAVEHLLSLQILDDGRTIATYYDEEWNLCVGEYDLSKNKVKEFGKLTDTRGYEPVVTPDGRLFSIGATELVEYELETLKEKGAEINWFNSDINPNYVQNLLYEDGAFYSVDQSEWKKAKLLKMTPCDDVIEKYVIDLACIGLDYEISDKIIKFNRAEEEHRIVVRDYSEWDEEGNQLGIQKLDNEIIKGNVPDIIRLGDLDFKKYASKKILTDLGRLIDEDEDISRDDFLKNVLEFGTENGTLYSLITGFGVSTVIGKTSVVGDRTSWTWTDLNKTLSRYPDAIAFSNIEREPLLRNILQVSLYDFIDYTTGQTKFESDEFRALLEFVKPYPEKINWETYYEDYDWEVEQSKLRENKILLETRHFSSAYDAEYALSNNNFGEEVSFVGYPTSDGCGSVIVPRGEWAIAESSPFKEKALDFLKILTDEDTAEDMYVFPSNKKAFEKTFDNIITSDDNPEQITENSVIIEDKLIVDDGFYEEYETPLTREQVDDFEKFIKGVSRRQAPYNHDVIDIIVEESAAYFAGEKSIDETCRIIQSRAFIYVSENM